MHRCFCQYLLNCSCTMHCVVKSHQLQPIPNALRNREKDDNGIPFLYFCRCVHVDISSISLCVAVPVYVPKLYALYALPCIDSYIL